MVVFVSCDKKSKVEAAVEEIPVTIKVERFDKLFFETKPEDLGKLKKEFPSANPTMENGTEIYLRDPDNIRVQLSAKDYKG